MFGISAGIIGSASGFTGLLDAYPNAAAAYSVRLLRSDYTGNCIEVRRSSDNTTQNIGFTVSGDLDTASLLSFVGAGDGFVRTWYDQSGNTNNAQQTTALNQPQIVSSGVLLSNNSQPKIDFSSSFLQHGALMGSALSLFTVHENTDNFTTFNSAYSSRKNGATFTNNGYTLIHSNDSPTNTVVIQTRDGTSINRITYTNAVTGNKITSHINNGAGVGISTHSYFVNSAQKATQTNASPIAYSASNDYMIGADDRNGTYPFIGNIQEVIIYTTDQSANRIGIESNINSYFSIY